MLELPILFLELLQASQLGDALTLKLPLPAVEQPALSEVEWVFSETPTFRQTSPTDVPLSACRKAKAICSCVSLDLFTE